MLRGFAMMFHDALRPLAAIAAVRSVTGRKRRPAALIVAFATIAAAQPVAATVTPSWNGWRWARSGDVHLAVGDNLSAAWKPYLAQATAAWSADPIIDMTPVAGASPLAKCAPVYGTIQACNGAYGFNGWLGYANVWVSSGYIVMATVRLNDSYFANATYNSDAWRQATMCHELGHTLGLNHPNTNYTNANVGSCLDYTRDPTGLVTNGPLSNMAPSAGDFAGLAALYATPGGTQLAQTKFVISVGNANAVPEPATWMLLVAGFGLVGRQMRRRQPQLSAN